MEDAKQERKPLKIAIVGTSPTSQHLAPFDDPEWEIWGCSTGPFHIPRQTRWFEVHDLKRKRRQCPQYYEWLCETDLPVYLDQPDKNIKNGLTEWRQGVLDRFSQYFHQDNYAYLTNSISWMVCQAIIEIEQNGGCGEIAIYGVDMACGTICVGSADSEYAKQRPSCEYWIGWCHGAGIKMHIPKESDLLKSREMYGFDTDNNGMYYRMVVRGDELHTRKSNVDGAIDKAEKGLAMSAGARQAIEQLLEKTHGKPTENDFQGVLEALRVQGDQYSKEVRDLTVVKHKLDGAIMNHDHFQQGAPAEFNLYGEP